MIPDQKTIHQTEVDLDPDFEAEGEENVTSFRRSRVKRSRTYQKIEKKYLRTRNIASVLVVSLLAGAALSITSLKRVSDENYVLKNEQGNLEQHIERLSTEQQKLRLENDMLVQGRIPDLSLLKFDEPYRIDDPSLQSIVFTRTQQDGKFSYEYLAVIKNKTTEVIKPETNVLLFDRLGKQVGQTHVTKPGILGNHVQLISLQPGESRSFSDKFILSSDVEPKYFLVNTK